MGPNGIGRVLRVLGAVALVLMLLGSIPGRAFASGTATVASCSWNGTSGSDFSSALTSLTANSTLSGTISIACSGTITMPANTQAINVNGALTVQNSGGSTPTLDGAGQSLFNVASSGSLSISGLTVTGAHSASDGGAITSQGPLTLSYDAFTGNSSGSSGGAVYVAGNGSLNADNVTFSNNTAGTYGGALEVDVNTSSTWSLSNDTFSNNTSVLNGGALNANLVTVPGAVAPIANLSNSTFNGNTVTNGGNWGGAVGLGTASPVSFLNDTITNNSAAQGGAIMSFGTVYMAYSTIEGNTEGPGGGQALYFPSGPTGGADTMFIVGTILDNTSNCSSPLNLTDYGDNLTYGVTGAGDNCGLTASTDVSGKDPLLQSLANNGGPNQTMALASTSPAVDAGPAVCTDALHPGADVLSTDERGLTRPVGTCDIGAYELQTSSCPSVPSYPNGFANQSCLTVNQAAVPNFNPPPNPAVASNVLTLTNNTGQDASAFYANQIDVTQPFNTQFSFSIAQLSGQLADGMTFVIQGQGAQALGCNGGNLGVGFPSGSTCGVTSVTGALAPSVAVEFDTLADGTGVSAGTGCSNTGGQHVAIDVNGDVSNATKPAVCYPLENTPSGATVTSAWIDYDGKNLNVYLAPQGKSKPGSPTLTYPVSLANAIGKNSAYFGFTGATGSSGSTQSIQQWTLNSASPAPAFTPGQDGGYTWSGTSNNPLSITGTAVPNATVDLYSGSTCAGTSIASTGVDSSGGWSFSLSGLAEGPSTYSASLGGNAAACSGSITANVDRTEPSSSVTSPALGTSAVYLNAAGWAKGCGVGSAYNICGTASDGGAGVAAVFVAVEGPGGGFWNGQTGSGAAFNSGGTWVPANGTTSWGLNVPLPPEGVYTVASAAVDNAGNVQQIFQQSIAGICDPSQTHGSLSLNGGSLSLNGGSLSLNGGQLSINGGLCTVNAKDANNQPVSGQLSLNGGSLSLNGGSLPLNGGSLSLNGGSLPLNGGSCTVNTSTGSGTLSLNGGTLASTGGTLSLNGGSLSLNGGSLSLNGGTLSLNGGSLSLNGGSLPLNGGNCTVTPSTGTGSGSLSLNGGSLSLNGGTLSLNGGTLSLNGGSLPLNGGQLSLNGGSLSINGGAGGNAGNVVVDTTPPVVSNFTVDGQTTSGAANIDPSSTFHIAFSESMLPSTVNGTTISVSPGPGTGPACDVGDTTCLNASFKGFQPNTVYTVNISGVTDLAGNPIASTSTSSNPTTFTFTTASAPPFATSVTRGTPGHDDDGDNIPNGWDGTSTPSFTAGGVSTTTAAWGFSSQHKDLCVVENYMSGVAANGTTYDQHITQAANQALVNAFANSPVTNPDGTHGVHLVIFEGPNFSAGLPAGYSGPYFGGKISMVDPLGNTNNSAFSWNGVNGSQSPSTSSFDAIRRANFLQTGLSQFCHYAVIAHGLGGSGSSGASRGIGAGEFVIALGGTVIGKGVGTQQEQQGTVMHELGHNLGLHHGGGPNINPTACGVHRPDVTLCDMDVNYKPDYMSVMNYFYQFEGVAGGFTTNGLDYSHGTVTTSLDETNLLDSMGLGPGATPSGGMVFGTRYFCPGTTNPTPNIVANASQPINWGCASSLPPSGTSIRTDINGDGAPEVMHDYNDWANLTFNGGSIGMGSVPPAPDTTTVDISNTLDDPYDGGVDSAPAIEGSALAQFAGTGFFSPINSDTTGKVVNSGKGGRTYPVKFQLKDATGNYVSALSAVRSITYSSSGACSGGTTDPIDTSTTSTAGLHYDSTANQFVYNWATPGTGCYILNVNLADGTTYQSLFSLS
jgi:predicted outer membrane repeat protein